MNRLEIIGGLVDGRTLNIYDRTCEAAKIVGDLLFENKITTELVELDEQSTVMKVRWKDG